MSKKQKRSRKNRRSNKKAPTKPNMATVNSTVAEDKTEKNRSNASGTDVSANIGGDNNLKSEESSTLADNSSLNDIKITSSTMNAPKEVASQNPEIESKSEKEETENIDQQTSSRIVASLDEPKSTTPDEQEADHTPIIDESEDKVVEEEGTFQEKGSVVTEKNETTKEEGGKGLSNEGEQDLPWNTDESKNEKMPWEVEKRADDNIASSEEKEITTQIEATVEAPQTEDIDKDKIEGKHIVEEKNGTGLSSSIRNDVRTEKEDGSQDNDQEVAEQSQETKPLTSQTTSKLPWEENEETEDSIMPWEEDKHASQVVHNNGTDEIKEDGTVPNEKSIAQDEDEDSFLKELSESNQNKLAEKSEPEKEPAIIHEKETHAVEHDKVEERTGLEEKQTKLSTVEDKLGFLQDDNEILLDDIMDDELLDDEGEEAEESIKNEGSNTAKPQATSPYVPYSPTESVISSVSERIARPLSPKMQKYVPGDRAASPPMHRLSNNYVSHTLSHTSSINVPVRRAVSPISQFTEPPRQGRVQNETSQEHRHLLQKLAEEKHRSDAYDFPDDLLSKFSPVQGAAKLPVRNIYADIEKKKKAQETYLTTPNAARGGNSSGKVLPPAAQTHKTPPALKRPPETSRYAPSAPPVSNVARPSAAEINSNAPSQIQPVQPPMTHPVSEMEKLSEQEAQVKGVPPAPKKAAPFFSELPTPKNLSKPTPPVNNPYAPRQTAVKHAEVPALNNMTSPRSRKSTMNWYAPSNAGGHLKTPSVNVSQEPIRANVVPVPRKISMGSSQGAPPALHVSTEASVNRYTPQTSQMQTQQGQQAQQALQTQQQSVQLTSPTARLTSPRTHHPRQSIDVLYDSPLADSTVPSALTRSRIHRGSSAAPPPPANGHGSRGRHKEASISQPAPVVVHPENLVKRQWPLFSFCNSSSKFASMIPSSDGYGHRIANIQVTPLSSILKDSADELTAKFPGPLSSSSGRSASKELSSWLTLKLKSLGKDQLSAETVYITVEEKIWAILKIMIEEVHGPGDLAKPSYLEKVIKVINASCSVPKQKQALDTVELERAAVASETNRYNHPNNSEAVQGVVPTNIVDRNGLSRIYGLLEQGETVTALEVALSAGDWALAITLAGLLGPSAISTVVHLYARHRFSPSDPLAQNLSFFITVAGSANVSHNSGTGKDSTLEDMMQFSAPWIVDNIESIVPFMLSNLPRPGPILYRLSSLLKDHDDNSHALLCRLLSGFPPDAVCQSVDGSIAEEIYMYILITARCMPASVNRQISTQHITTLRLLRTGYLADTGHFTEARKYLDAVASHSSASKRQGALDMSSALEFEKLSDRLSRVPNGAKPHMSRVWDRLDKSFNKFVAGEDLSSKQETPSEVFSNYSTPAVSRNASVMDFAANFGPQSIMNQAFPQPPAPSFAPDSRPKLPYLTRSSSYLPKKATFDLNGQSNIAPHSSNLVHEPRTAINNLYAPPAQHLESTMVHSSVSNISPSKFNPAKPQPSIYANDYPFTSTPSSPPSRPYIKRYASSTASDASSLNRVPLHPPTFNEKLIAPGSKLPHKEIVSKRNASVPSKPEGLPGTESLPKPPALANQPVVQAQLPQVKSLTHKPLPPPKMTKPNETNVRKVPSDPVSQMLEGDTKSLEPKREIAGTPLVPGQFNQGDKKENAVSGDSSTFAKERDTTERVPSNNSLNITGKPAFLPLESEEPASVLDDETNTEQKRDVIEEEHIANEEEHVREADQHVLQPPVDAINETTTDNKAGSPSSKDLLSSKEDSKDEKITDSTMKAESESAPELEAAAQPPALEKKPPPSLKRAPPPCKTVPPSASIAQNVNVGPQDSLYGIALPGQSERKSVKNGKTLKLDTALPPYATKAPSTKASSSKAPKNPYAALYSKAHKVSTLNKNSNSYTPKNAEPKEEGETASNGDQFSSQVQLNEMGIPTDMSGVDIYGFGGYHVPPPSRQNDSEPNIDLKENHSENVFKEREPEMDHNRLESIGRVAASSDFGEPETPITPATDNVINPAANLRNIFSPPRLGNISHRSSFSRRPSQMSSRRSSIASPLSVDETIASKQSAIYTITEEKKLYANEADEYFDDDIVNDSSSEEGNFAKEQEERLRKEAEDKKRKEEEIKKHEAAEKKEQEQEKKNKNRESTAHKGWFSWLSHKDDGPKPIKAKLGEENQFHYDEKLKRWINKNVPVEEQTIGTPPPPPMKGESASKPLQPPSLQPPPGSPPHANSSTPSKPPVPGPLKKDGDGIDGLLSLSAGIQRNKKRSRRGPRRGYVDVMALQSKK